MSYFEQIKPYKASLFTRLAKLDERFWFYNFKEVIYIGIAAFGIVLFGLMGLGATVAKGLGIME